MLRREKLIDVFVPGMPLAKGSPRLLVVKGRTKPVESGAEIEWERTVRTWALTVARPRPVLCDEGPIAVRLRFYLRPPQTARAARGGIVEASSRPYDVDKLARAILDALQGSKTQRPVIMADDKQVVLLSASKTLVERGARTGVHIRAWRLAS